MNDTDKNNPEIQEIPVPGQTPPNETAPELSPDSAELFSQDSPSEAPVQEDILPVESEAFGEEQPPEKRFSLKKLLILAGAVIAAAGILALVISVLNNRPMALITGSARKSIKAAESTELTRFSKDLLSGGSIKLKASAPGEYLELPEDASVSAEFALYPNIDSGRLALTAGISAKEQDLADAVFTLNEDEMILSSAVFLGKSNYGVSFKNLNKNLKGSVLDPASCSYYALSEEAFHELLSLTTDYKKENTALLKQGEKLKEAFFKALLSSFEDHAEFSKDKDELTLGSKEFKIKIVSAELDEKGLSAFVLDLMTWARENKELNSFLNEVLEKAKYPLEEEGMDSQELLSGFYEGLDEYLDHSDNLREILEDCTLTLNFSINRENGQMVECEAILKGFSTNRQVLTLTFGPDMKAAELLQISFKDGSDKSTVSYTVTADTDKEYTAELIKKYTSADSGFLVNKTDTDSLGSFDWNKTDGSFTLKSQHAGFTLTGFLNKSAKQISVNLDKLSRFPAAQSETELAGLGTLITLNRSEKAPSISKYTDLLTLQEEDFEELADGLQKGLAELETKLSESIS